jgi:hypothetical protein
MTPVFDRSYASVRTADPRARRVSLVENKVVVIP